MVDRVVLEQEVANPREDLGLRYAGIVPPFHLVAMPVEAVAEAVVQATFEVTVKKGKEKVAGCKMETGKMLRKHKVRVQRHNQTVFEGQLRSMRHFKREVDELVKGQECGLVLDGFEDFEVGDVIQGIVVTEIRRTIN